MMRGLIPFLALWALAACGNDDRTTPLDDLTEIAVTVRDGQREATTPDPRAMAQVAMTQMSEPVMLAVLEDRAAVALTVPYGENGATRTWTTIDKQTLALSSGRLIATRGLGFDLMSHEGPRRPTVGKTTRRLNTINAAAERESIILNCETPQPIRETIDLMSGESLTALRYTETCRGGGYKVQNLIWMTPAGDMRQSRQWVGPGAGFLTLQVLRPPE